MGRAWGYRTDPSGLVQLGARYYWPELGRFIQQDPIRDGINWYTYAENNPLTYIDPSGLCRHSFGIYLGIGGEVTWGTNPDGGWFFGVHGGVGAGGGYTVDPCGTSPGWSPSNPPGLSGYLGASASAGGHWGWAGGAAGAEAGGYFSPKGPTSPTGVKGYHHAGANPEFGPGNGVGGGANAGIDVGFVGQPWPF